MEETEETVSRIKGKILDKKHEIFELEDEIAYLTSQRDILDSGFYPR